MTVEIFGDPEPGPLTIAEYSADWPRRYEHERQRIVDALGPTLRDIEHIGSTSVPGLAAKPIIDIVAAVPNIDDEDAYMPPLVAAGYVPRVREPGHRMFRTPDRDVHVHLYTEGDPEYDAVVDFRDWLRTHPEDRVRYEALKRELAPQPWSDTQAYADAKGPLVDEIKAKVKRMSSR